MSRRLVRCLGGRLDGTVVEVTWPARHVLIRPLPAPPPDMTLETAEVPLHVELREERYRLHRLVHDASGIPEVCYVAED